MFGSDARALGWSRVGYVVFSVAEQRMTPSRGGARLASCGDDRGVVESRSSSGATADEEGIGPEALIHRAARTLGSGVAENA